MDIAEEIEAREGHKKIIGKRILEEGLREVLKDGNQDLIYGYKKLKQDI